MLPGGSNFGGSFRSPIYAFMMSIQIGSATSAPVAPGPSVLLLVVADPDADRDVGIEADEPRVGVVVGRAGLAADRPVERRRLRRGAALDDARSRFVMTKAVSARIASFGSGRFSSRTLPSRSVTLSTEYGRIRTP